MYKIIKNALKDLKKSNQARKIKLANKNGFGTVAEYAAYLNTKLSELVDTQIPVIHIMYVQDSSGSMFDFNNPYKFHAAIKGIETEIEELKKRTDVFYVVSIYEFSTELKCIVANAPIQEVKNIDWKQMRQRTSLNDTIVQIVKTAKKLKEDKVLIKIFTDGSDVGSRNSIASAKSYIDSLPENITFTFVAASDDERNIARYNIDETNILYHANTVESIGETFSVTTSSTMTYTDRAIKGEDVSRGFYKEIVN